MAAARPADAQPADAAPAAQETLASVFGLGKAAGALAAGTVLSQASSAVAGAVGHAKEKLAELTQPQDRTVPCATCGLPTLAGDGGACGDTKEMADVPKAEAPVKERCRSCLTTTEKESVREVIDRQRNTLELFFKGAVGEEFQEPEESKVVMAHRLGTVALQGLGNILEWVPMLPRGLPTAVKAIHGIVKYGPLAIYSNEAMEAVQLLATLASRSGVATTAADKEGGQDKQADTTADQGRLRNAQAAATDATELSLGLYYLLIERRNAIGIDPNAAKREHAKCPAVELPALVELADFMAFSNPIAYASSNAEAQRQLRLMKGAWELVLSEQALPGGCPSFILAADKKAKQAAVLVPGTQSAADCVTDLRALPVRMPLGPGWPRGWAHRGMLRQASGLVRIVGGALESFEKAGYQTFFVGHSLGAAVSALAGAVLRLGLEGPKALKVRSLCYATPACGNAALGRFCEAHAITVINCDDIVPRLSIETARRLRSELDERREVVRAYVKQDVDALKSVQNLTEAKRRNTGGANDTSKGDEEELLGRLSVPAPSQQGEANSKVTSLKEPVPSEASKPARPKKGLCSCFGGAGSKDSDEEPLPPEEPEEVETDDPAEVKLYPPGRLVHLYRHYGARRAAWIRRTHPALHRIEVMFGLMQDHSGDSYRNGLEEALFAARGFQPPAWKPFAEVPKCSCCNSDFTWASVLRSEPHRLQSRHHCHSCGNVVCDGCSQKRRALPSAGVTSEVRVCDKCFLRPVDSASPNRI